MIRSLTEVIHVEEKVNRETVCDVDTPSKHIWRLHQKWGSSRQTRLAPESIALSRDGSSIKDHVVLRLLEPFYLNHPLQMLPLRCDKSLEPADMTPDELLTDSGVP